jgi:hypothetical protein
MGFARLSGDDTRRVLKRALREDTSPLTAAERDAERRGAPAQPGPRFCDTCRAQGLAKRPSCSDDELLVLLMAALYGLDAVALLVSEVQFTQKRLKRKGEGNPMPGISRILRDAGKKVRARRVVEGATGPDCPAIWQEADRTGKTPEAIRQRLYRALKVLRPK